MNCNIYLPHYCRICGSKKTCPQMPEISHMFKALDMYLWGKYANIHAIYEVAPIDYVARIVVHR